MDAAQQLDQGPLRHPLRDRSAASAGRMAHRLLDSRALYLRLETSPLTFESFGLAPLRALMDPLCVAKAWVNSALIRIICDV
jgi:hypothetical protein